MPNTLHYQILITEDYWELPHTWRDLLEMLEPSVMRGWEDIWMEMKWSRPTCFGSRARTEEFRAFENSEDLARKKNLNYLSPFLDGNTGPIKVEGECTSEVFQKKQRTSYLTSSTVACRLADSRHPRKAASHRKRPGSYSFKTSIWLIQGRSTIKKVINRCRICRHFK